MHVPSINLKSSVVLWPWGPCMLVLGTGLSWLALLLLLIAGVAILVFIIKSVLFFLPPAIVALVTYYITSDLTLTGIAFILVTLLMLIVRR